MSPDDDGDLKTQASAAVTQLLAAELARRLKGVDALTPSALQHEIAQAVEQLARADLDEVLAHVETPTTDIAKLMGKRSVAVPVVQRMTQASVLNEVDKYIGQFAHQPTVVVRDTAQDVLPGVQDGDAISGAVHDGKIYLFLDQLANAKEVQETLFHELLHYGLRKIFSRDQFVTEMHKLYRHDDEIRRYADSWVATPEGAAAEVFDGPDYARARGVDEALAMLAEPNAGEFMRTNFSSRVVQNVSRWLADLAQTFGFDGVAAKLRGLRNHEARELIKNVFHRLRSDPNPTFSGAWASTDTAYARSNSNNSDGETMPLSGEKAIKPNPRLTSFDLQDALIFLEKAGAITQEKFATFGKAIHFPDEFPDEFEYPGESALAQIASLINLARDKGWKAHAMQTNEDKPKDDLPNAAQHSKDLEADAPVSIGLYGELNEAGLRAARDREKREGGREDQAGNEREDVASATQPLNGVMPAAVMHDDNDWTDEKTLLASLAEQYRHDGFGSYYFREGAGTQLAFEDKGTQLTTPHHSAEVVGSLARLVAARGWKDIRLQGSTEFKREMWLQAKLLGINVSGYEPEPIDQLNLNERRATLAADTKQQDKPIRQSNVNTAPQDTAQTATVLPFVKPDKGTGTATGATTRKPTAVELEIQQALISQGGDGAAVEKVMDELRPKLPTSRAYVGEVVGHGSAPYKFDEKEQGNYFVKLATKDNKQLTVWGVDLARVMADLTDSGGPVEGPILLAYQGAKTVRVPKRNEDGGIEWSEGPRNEWFARSLDDAIAQAQRELNHAKDPADFSDTKTALPPPQEDPLLVAPSPIARQAENSAPSRARMQSLAPAQDRLRRALDALGGMNALERETTLTSLAALFDSPKLQVGQLLKHGEAPHAFAQGGRQSYYVSLRTENGDVFVWGPDLRRAINKQRLHEGDVVVVAHRGLVDVADTNGQVALRNDWLVSPLKALHDDAQQGVMQTVDGLGGQESNLDSSFMTPTHQTSTSLKVLSDAMKLANVPPAIANATLRQAQVITRGQGIKSPSLKPPSSMPPSMPPKRGMSL